MSSLTSHLSIHILLIMKYEETPRQPTVKSKRNQSGDKASRLLDFLIFVPFVAVLVAFVLTAALSDRPPEVIERILQDVRDSALSPGLHGAHPHLVRVDFPQIYLEITTIRKVKIVLCRFKIYSLSLEIQKCIEVMTYPSSDLTH